VVAVSDKCSITNVLNQDGTGVPATLRALPGYLRQVSSLADAEVIKFRPDLIRDLEVAAQAAEKEQEGKPCSTRESAN